MLQEHRLVPSDFIMPIFINENLQQSREIGSLPGVFQQSLSSLLMEVAAIQKVGISAVLLFGIPNKKDAVDIVFHISSEHDYMIQIVRWQCGLTVFSLYTVNLLV